MRDRNLTNEIRKRRRIARKKKLMELLGSKCKNCGSKKNLEFDHIDRTKKLFDISYAIDKPEQDLLEEVRKCQLLCKDCHKKKTKDSGDFALPPSDHGTIHHYKNHKCRCDKCREAMSKYYYVKIKSSD